MNSESELLAALMALEPIVEEPIEDRIYYNDAGQITECSMRNHATAGKYLVVTQDEYENYFRYTVVNDQLKKIDIQHNYHVKLIKSNTGYAVVKNHAGVLIEPTETYTDIEYYDRIS